MLYQSQLMYDQPYFAKKSTAHSFPLHIHHENEILYALNCDFEIKTGGRVYRVERGQAAIINSMVMHEIRVPNDEGNFLVIEVGPALLREQFSLIKDLNFEIRIYSRDERPEIFEHIDSINEICQDTAPAACLFMMGELLKLYAAFYTALIEDDMKTGRGSVCDRSARSIESVLKYVYEHYSEDIKIDTIASACGYSKSGFCKAFKVGTGFTFHSYLNLCRVRNAEHLLVESNKTLDEIAGMVGMKEAKVLCREFKKRVGVTPRSYRLAARRENDRTEEKTK